MADDKLLSPRWRGMRLQFPTRQCLLSSGTGLLDWSAQLSIYLVRTKLFGGKKQELLVRRTGLENLNFFVELFI